MGALPTTVAVAALSTVCVVVGEIEPLKCRRPYIDGRDRVTADSERRCGEYGQTTGERAAAERTAAELPSSQPRADLVPMRLRKFILAPRSRGVSTSRRRFSSSLLRP